MMAAAKVGTHARSEKFSRESDRDGGSGSQCSPDFPALERVCAAFMSAMRPFLAGQCRLMRMLRGQN